MPDLELVPTGDCTNPAVADVLPDYCFGALSAEQSRTVEAHILQCPICRAKRAMLARAVDSLRNDKELVKTITAADVATAFGPSGKLKEVSLGGHRAHIWTAAVLYSSYFASALLLEVAYQWDRLGTRAVVAAPIVFAILTAGIVWLAHLIVKGERTNRRMGLGAAFGWLSLPIAVLYAAVCVFVLPNTNITLDHTTGWTARIAYLKNIGYMLPIALVFLIELFRSVVAVQAELGDGNTAQIAALFRGEKDSVAPRAVFFIRPRWLWTAIAVLIPVHIYLTWHLIDSLEPSPFQTLFLVLAFVRISSYFALICECMVWYHSALNELKRETFSAGSSCLNTIA